MKMYINRCLTMYIQPNRSSSLWTIHVYTVLFSFLPCLSPPSPLHLQLQVLTERVEELEQTEHAYIQEAQGFRETLNSAVRAQSKPQQYTNRAPYWFINLPSPSSLVYSTFMYICICVCKP